MAKNIKGIFTKEQQVQFQTLSKLEQRYVEFRGQGFSKTDSYKMTGYTGERAAQAARMMEKRKPQINELVQVLLDNKQANEITSAKGEGHLNDVIDAKASQVGVENVIKTIEGADSETAKRIQFFRDIVNGKIKSIKVVKKLDKNGNVVSTTRTETADVESRIKARKELDRLLGLSTVIELDSFKVNNITVNIVDATKKHEEIEETEPLDTSDFKESEGEPIEAEPEIEVDDE